MMDDSLYMTSFTLYSLPLPTPFLLSALLSSANEELKAHASRLRNHLTSGIRRPAYETEEENQKLGSLRTCDINSLPENQGVAIIINYDRAIYKFILPASHSSVPPQLPVLLVKASASFTKRIFNYLTEAFHLPSDPELLKLSTYFLLSTLENYVSSLRHSLSPVAETESIVSLLRDIIGKLKITITSTPGTSVAGALRTIDLDVSTEVLHQLLEQSLADPPRSRSKKDRPPQITFLESLREHISDRTGLHLPITPTTTKKPSSRASNNGSPAHEPPIRVTRIQSTAFAIGVEGRLKFSSKPVELMNTIPGLNNGDENVVKLANKDLLDAIIKEAESVMDQG